jgi:hypothetical protein
MRTEVEKKHKFYHLSPTFLPKWLWGQVRLDPMGSVYRDEIRRPGFKGTVSVSIDSGREPGDLLWNSHGLIIVSEKVKEVWRQFCRYDTYGVEIEGIHSDLRYTGIIITGHGGPIDHERSCTEFSAGADKRGERVMTGLRGLYFYEDRWDGSDLFYLDGSFLLVATERMVAAMRNMNITDCDYVPVEHVSF